MEKCEHLALSPLGGIPCPPDCQNRGNRFDGCHCQCAVIIEERRKVGKCLRCGQRLTQVTRRTTKRGEYTLGDFGIAPETPGGTGVCDVCSLEADLKSLVETALSSLFDWLSPRKI